MSETNAQPAGNAPAGERRKTNEFGLVNAPAVKTVAADAPWTWLAAGWRDMWHYPMLSLGYGVVFALVSVGLSAGLVALDLTSLSLAMAAGFMLVGPMLAVGMYELSRRLQAGAPIRARDVAFVKTKSPVQLAFLGVVLMFMLLAWINMARMVFAIVWGPDPFPPLNEFVQDLLFTVKGLTLLGIGSAVGGVLALAVFSVSAVSVPMLMERDMDAATAGFTSISAVNRNFKPMMVWGWLIVMLMAFGILTLFLGMIVTFPLIGHATWHAYRDLIEAPAA